MSREVCPKCGKVWQIRKMKLPMRDKDELYCDCGHVLMSWNGGVMYMADEVPEPHFLLRNKNDPSLFLGRGSTIYEPTGWVKKENAFVYGASDVRQMRLSEEMEWVER